MENLVIGLGGYAFSGKDTFHHYLSKSLINKGYPAALRFALADELKKEIRDWVLEHYRIDVWNCSSEEKQKIRPFLVYHGNFKREVSKGKHWIDILNKKIGLLSNTILTINDIRYDDFDGAEVKYVKEDCAGVLVHISQYEIKDGQKVYKAPPNDVEAYFDPRVKAKADYLVDWPKVSNLDELLPYTDAFVNWLIQHGKL